MSVLAFLLVLVYGLCLAFIFCYSLVQVHLTYLYIRSLSENKTREPSICKHPSELPFITIQLPVYNERYVVERLIDRITSFDYPSDKLQIQVLDDSDDETIQLISNKVKHYQAQGFNIAHVQRPYRTGFKAGALQYGLSLATGEFIAIFDADFLPDPEFLLTTIPAFAQSQVGVVQVRWAHLNDHYSLLTSLQAFGLNAHFTVEQVGRNYGHYFINFNGTAGIWRKACIEDAGGWQSDTLTEDLDLSYRAQLRNWEFRYFENISAPAELPATMPAVKSQQFRWTKGAAETARKNLGPVLRSNKSWLTKIHAVFHLGNSSVFICVLLTALLSLPMLFIQQFLPEYQSFFKLGALFLFSLVGLLLFYWTAYCRSVPDPSFIGFVPRFFWFLSLTMGLSLHNAIAVVEGFSGKKTPFIRTPKFNIRQRSDSWQNNQYRTTAISFLTIMEGLLAIYFLIGVALAFHFQKFGLLPLHIMLSLGFGGVFYYSLKHSH